MHHKEREPHWGNMHSEFAKQDNDFEGIEALRRQIQGVLEEMPEDPDMVLKRAKADANDLRPIFSRRWRMARVEPRRGIFRNLENAMQILYEKKGRLSLDEQDIQTIADDFTARQMEAETWLAQGKLPREREVIDHLYQTVVILHCDPDYSALSEQLKEFVIDANRALGKEAGEIVPPNKEL